jgi:hypothetical protein
MFFDEDAPQFARFDVSCVVQFEREHNAVWIWLMKGRLNRQLLRNLREWLESQRVETIKSQRAEGHRIPGGELQPEGSLHVSVSRMWARCLYCTSTSRWPNKKASARGPMHSNEHLQEPPRIREIDGAR